MISDKKPLKPQKRFLIIAKNSEDVKTVFFGNAEQTIGNARYRHLNSETYLRTKKQKAKTTVTFERRTK